MHVKLSRCHTNLVSTSGDLKRGELSKKSLFWQSCAGASRDEIILTAGTEIGALLVDGLGDGVALDCPSEDLEFLRTTSFGLLQVRAWFKFRS